MKFWNLIFVVSKAHIRARPPKQEVVFTMSQLLASFPLKFLIEQIALFERFVAWCDNGNQSEYF